MTTAQDGGKAVSLTHRPVQLIFSILLHHHISKLSGISDRKVLKCGAGEGWRRSVGHKSQIYTTIKKMLYNKGKAVPLQVWSGPEGSRN